MTDKTPVTKPNSASSAYCGAGSLLGLVLWQLWIPALYLQHEYPDCSYDEWLHPYVPNFYLSILLLSMLYMAGADLLLRVVLGLKANTTWYIIHTIVNAHVVYVSWNDLLLTFQNPQDSLAGFPLGRARDSMSQIIGLHIYHLVYFSCTREDYLHHGISCGIVGSLGCTVPIGKVMNAVNFFICGLPGGLDYFLLSLRSLGLMSSMKEKRINVLLNLLIRWPGIVLCMFCTILSKLANSDSDVGWIPIAIVVFLHGGNASFYCQKVIGNYWVVCHKLEAEKKTVKGSKSE